MTLLALSSSARAKLGLGSTICGLKHRMTLPDLSVDNLGNVDLD